VAYSHHFDEKQDTDTDLHPSEKSDPDPDPYQIERWIRILLKRGIMAWGGGY
jgi:hypothetical protein